MVLLKSGMDRNEVSIHTARLSSLESATPENKPQKSSNFFGFP
jgi:hypothetical protein